MGTTGRLLLEEKFDGDTLPKGWTVKSGGLRVADGILLASQKKDTDGRLGLFNCELPMQDAAIQIDFKFDGGQGINISCNPSPGELKKKGHLFSVMITRRMWNITEHNDKADRNSRSKALASAAGNFEPGKWYTLLLEFKGDDVVAQIEGKKPLRAASKDFRVKKPGIEFRVFRPRRRRGRLRQPAGVGTEVARARCISDTATRKDVLPCLATRCPRCSSYWVCLPPSPSRPPTPSLPRTKVEIRITSDKPVPINPKIYGINCAEMFIFDLVQKPEYLSALGELQLNTFLYPGGPPITTIPKGTGGFNIRPEELANRNTERITGSTRRVAGFFPAVRRVPEADGWPCRVHPQHLQGYGRRT